MTKQQDHSHTAQIYIFPSRPRAAQGGHSHAYVPAQKELTVVDCGAGWYHGAAIAECDDVGNFRRQH
jgi:Protein of unknown function (DUF2735)